MQIWKDVELTIERKTSKIKTLVDTGSTITLMGYETLRKFFGEIRPNILVRPMEAALLNGQKVIIDGYVDAQILIDNYLIEERIYLSKDMVREVILEGKRKSLPDLIIGVTTLEIRGLELDLKKGGIIYKGSFIN